MSKLFKAFSLGFKILTAIEQFKAGIPASLEVEWKGRVYKLTLEQS